MTGSCGICKSVTLEGKVSLLLLQHKMCIEESDTLLLLVLLSAISKTNHLWGERANWSALVLSECF